MAAGRNLCEMDDKGQAAWSGGENTGQKDLDLNPFLLLKPTGKLFNLRMPSFLLAEWGCENAV